MMDNPQRAASVSAFLDSFAKAMGLENEDPCTIAGDMIGNILHWVTDAVDGEGRIGALKAMKSGIGHYVTEQSITIEGDELGPDSHVSIKATCDGKTWCSVTGSTPEIY